MACGSCSRKNSERHPVTRENGVMGGFKYLTDRQIKARLELFKRKFCRECVDRYTCDYKNYLKCKGEPT